MSADYQRYLKSNHWKRLRRKLLGDGRGYCCACGLEALLVLHHVTYCRLGQERKVDLVPVCEMCHSMIHEKLNEVFPSVAPKRQAESTWMVWEGLFGESLQSALDRYGWTGNKTIKKPSRRPSSEAAKHIERQRRGRSWQSEYRSTIHKVQRSTVLCPKCHKRRRPKNIQNGRCTICIRREAKSAKQQSAGSPQSGYKPLVARRTRLVRLGGSGSG